MSRIVMAVFAIMTLSLMSVSVIQEYVIDRAKQTKANAKVEQPASVNPSAARNPVRSPYGQVPAIDDPGYLE